MGVTSPGKAGVEGGFPAKEDDPFYTGLSDQLADKGFLKIVQGKIHLETAEHLRDFLR